jgi:hypothetical protein
MRHEAFLLLLGVAIRGAHGLPALRVGHVQALLARQRPGQPVFRRLPPSALRLAEPLGFGAVAEMRAWLIVHEVRLVAALRTLAGGRSLALKLTLGEPPGTISRPAPDQIPSQAPGHAPEPEDGPARQAVAEQRLRSILLARMRLAVLADLHPHLGAERPVRHRTPPEMALQRLRAAMESQVLQLAAATLTPLLRTLDKGARTALVAVPEG